MKQLRLWFHETILGHDMIRRRRHGDTKYIRYLCWRCDLIVGGPKGFSFDWGRRTYRRCQRAKI